MIICTRELPQFAFIILSLQVLFKISNKRGCSGRKLIREDFTQILSPQWACHIFWITGRNFQSISTIKSYEKKLRAELIWLVTAQKEPTNLIVSLDSSKCDCPRNTWCEAQGVSNQRKIFLVLKLIITVTDKLLKTIKNLSDWPLLFNRRNSLTVKCYISISNKSLGRKFLLLSASHSSSSPIMVIKSKKPTTYQL